MTKVCRETFLRKMETTLREYGYKIVHIDEDVLAIGNPHNNLYGIFTNLYNNTFQCTLKLTAGNKNLFILDHKTFSYKETDGALSVLKTVMDETNNIIKVSKTFVDSLPSVSGGIDTDIVGYEYTRHFKAEIGLKRYFQGLNYTLTVCLTESLDLRVCVENDTMRKLVFSKILTRSNYQEMFGEVDLLITQFLRDCGISKELRELCG